MCYIAVNHQILIEAASDMKIHELIHNNILNQANNTVANLEMKWSGMDYTQYKAQWSRITADDSTSKNITNKMSEFSEFLRYASEQYKNAQITAVSHAKKISIVTGGTRYIPLHEH